MSELERLCALLGREVHTSPNAPTPWLRVFRMGARTVEFIEYGPNAEAEAVRTLARQVFP